MIGMFRVITEWNWDDMQDPDVRAGLSMSGSHLRDGWGDGCFYVSIFSNPGSRRRRKRGKEWKRKSGGKESGIECILTSSSAPLLPFLNSGGKMQGGAVQVAAQLPGKQVAFGTSCQVLELALLRVNLQYRQSPNAKGMGATGHLEIIFLLAMPFFLSGTCPHLVFCQQDETGHEDVHNIAQT